MDITCVASVVLFIALVNAISGNVNHVILCINTNVNGIRQNTKLHREFKNRTLSECLFVTLANVNRFIKYFYHKNSSVFITVLEAT